MKFHELSIGERFTFNNKTYIKLREERANCCKVRANCQNVKTQEKEVVDPMSEVEKLN